MSETGAASGASNAIGIASRAKTATAWSQPLDARVRNRDTAPQTGGAEFLTLGETCANLFRVKTAAPFKKIRDGLEGARLVRRVEVKNNVVARQQLADHVARPHRDLARVAGADDIHVQTWLFHSHCLAPATLQRADMQYR